MKPHIILAQRYILLALIVILAVAIVWPFTFGNQIIYGSMISWQFFPNTAAFFLDLKDSSFPFFNWDFALGFNILSESQISILHPIKIIIASLSTSSFAIDTNFLIFHYLMLFLSMFLLTKQLIKKNICDAQLYHAVFLGVASFCFSIALYANFLHGMFIVSLTYGIFLLYLTDKFMEGPRSILLFLIAITTTLMLLAGHFGMQWLLLLFIVAYALLKCVLFGRSLKHAIPIFTSIALGFCIALPQLIPTFESMQFSGRSDIGGIEMLGQSPGPFQWLGYLAPGASYFLFKHAPEVYSIVGRNNVVEGIHYVGIVPVVLTIMILTSKELMRRNIRVLAVCFLFFYLKSLGAFSPVNLLLNYVPIFGQFRVPVRSFFMIDIIICILAAGCLLRPLDRASIARCAKTLMVIVVVTISFSVIITFARSLFAGQNMPPLTLSEILYLVFSLITLAAIIAVVKQKILSDNWLRTLLVLIAIFDTSIHLIGVPTHWRSVSQSIVAERANEVDALCDSQKISTVYYDDNWPNFDLPLFRLGKGNQSHYLTEDDAPPQLNGTTCSINYSMSTSTLTPKSVRKLESWVNSTDNIDFREEALNLIGYKHKANLKSDLSDGEIINVVSINDTQSYGATTLAKFAKFISSFEPELPTARFDILSKLSENFIFHKLKHKLNSKVLSPIHIDGLGNLVMLPPPFSYILTLDNVAIFPKEIRGSFAVFDEKLPEEIVVTYVPLSFLAGVLGSLLGLVLLIIVLKLYTSPKFYTERNYTRLLVFSENQQMKWVGDLLEYKNTKTALLLTIISLIGYSAIIQFSKGFEWLAIYLVAVASITILTMAFYLILRIGLNVKKSGNISLVLMLSYIFGLIVIYIS